MTIQTFIEKAIEGGWNKNAVGMFGEEVMSNAGLSFKADVFLDPLAWKAVGRVERWDGMERNKVGGLSKPWLVRMHRMIDALAEGKTIEQFLETL